MGKEKGKGKGNQAKFSQPQVLELQFHERANSLFELLMNWNAQPQQLENAWREVMELRTKSMKAYGHAPPSGGQGADGGPAWKSEFYSCYTRKHKETLTKDDITFDITEVDGPKPGTKQYIATLSCKNLSDSYQGDEPSKSKKEAEHAAAKAAIQVEFPADFKRLSMGATPVVKGQKRKADALNNGQPLDAKQKLNEGAQLLAGHSMTKGDIVYEVAEENSQFTATVTLKLIDPSTGYQGLPAESKKAAESAAAEAALTALADQIATAQAEHAAKKKKVSQEKLALFKAKKDEKDGKTGGLA